MTAEQERMLAWLEKARVAGEWPASLDAGRGKFTETYEMIKALVMSPSGRRGLKVKVVHTAGRGTNEEDRRN